MSASDCYELGRALYSHGDYKHALAWMMETLRKYSEEDVELSFDRTDILEYIAFSHYLLGEWDFVFGASVDVRNRWR